MKEPSVNILDSVSGNLADLSAEALEVGVDQFIDNELLKEIPIFGGAVKIYNLSQRISEGFFMKKIARFLFQLKDIPKEKRERFIHKLEDEKENRKVGEKLLIMLNKLDEVDKASIIGNLFKAFIEAKIDYNQFLRLSNLVDKSLLDDLFILKRTPDVSNSIALKGVKHNAQESMLQSGLIIQVQGAYVSSDGRDLMVMRYSLNARLLKEHGFS